MELFLFTADLDFALRAERAGIDSVIIDFERKGKDARQEGFDLETNGDTIEDVYKLSKALKIPVTARVNCVGEHTPSEVESVLLNGAKCLMLPMARKTEEVGEFLDIVRGRAETIIQIETKELTSEVSELAKLDWTYVYIGLNDLMISRGGSFIWEAVLDGTVESILGALKGRRYGFGGITVIGGGAPVNFELILHELTRLDCSLSFMRRTLKKEIMDRDIDSEIRALRAFIDCSTRRGPEAKSYDHDRLCKQIEKCIHKIDTGAALYGVNTCR